MTHVHNGARLFAADLNLLVIAAAVYQHRNVSKAARELGISQSAVSHALTRLRDLFKDPMFVRTSKGVAPTSFARGIQDEVMDVIERTGQLLARQQAFDPKESRARITIATTEYFETVILTKLMPFLAKEAPHLQISIRSTGSELPKRDLEDGKVDMAVAGFYSDLPEGFYQAKLFTDTFACGAGKKHPSFRAKELDADAYFDSRHALITLQGDFRDSIARKVGKEKQAREIVYGSHSFTSHAWMLSETDLLLTAPKRLLETFSRYFPVRIFPCPVEIDAIEFRMVWHSMTHSTPIHTWFRNQLRLHL